MDMRQFGGIIIKYGSVMYIYTGVYIIDENQAYFIYTVQFLSYLGILLCFVSCEYIVFKTLKIFVLKSGQGESVLVRLV